MKRNYVILAAVAGAVILGSGYAYALSCIAPVYRARLAPVDGAPDGLCLASEYYGRLVVYPCESLVMFDDEEFTR